MDCPNCEILRRKQETILERILSWDSGRLKIIDQLAHEVTHTITHKYDREGEPCFCEVRFGHAKQAAELLLSHETTEKRVLEQVGLHLQLGFFPNSMRMLLRWYPELKMEVPRGMDERVLDPTPYVQA